MRIRVLVAEDHPLVREPSSRRRARSRDRGRRRGLQRHHGDGAGPPVKPEVMVLDLRMPGLGGALVLERLRAELSDIRALVMTANEESLLDAIAAGAAGYLSKRTNGEELRQGGHHDPWRRLGHHARARRPPAARVLG